MSVIHGGPWDLAWVCTEEVTQDGSWPCCEGKYVISGLGLRPTWRRTPGEGAGGGWIQPTVPMWRALGVEAQVMHTRVLEGDAPSLGPAQAWPSSRRLGLPRTLCNNTTSINTAPPSVLGSLWQMIAPQGMGPSSVQPDGQKHRRPGTPTHGGFARTCAA